MDRLDPADADGASPVHWIALTGVVLAALAVRSFGFEWVFVEDGVVFPPADAQYHVRRSLYTFVHWPRVLMWDPYINHPDGAAVAWPPLFDFIVGSVARLVASSEAGFERVAAWASPVAGALATIPVYLVGARVASRGVGLGAAAFFALLPISVNYGRVGNADHHATVAFFGAWLLLAASELVRPDPTRRQLLLRIALLGFARAAIMTTWHGSILYLGILEGTLLVAAVFTGRRDLFLAEAASSALTLAVLVPIVAASPTPLGGDYSAIALSRLHCIGVATVMAASGFLFFLETRGPLRSPAARTAWLALAGVAVLAVVFAFPGPREGLEPGLRFITMRDDVGPRTGEQFPLFEMFGRRPPQPAEATWGYLAYLIPLAPLGLAFYVEEERRRASALLVAGWAAFFGILTLSQRRYGNDLSPAGAVAFSATVALVVDGVASRVSLGRALRVALALAIGAALLSPGVLIRHARRAVGSLAVLTGAPGPADPELATVAGSLRRFAREVRRVTPETAGFLDPELRPEYGLVADANLGHALHYEARRATPTDPFWAYIGQENWDRNYGFLDAATESEALDFAEQLRARYVVTIPDKRADSVVGQLHYFDGSARGDRPALGHFRLVAEGPKGGKPLRDIFGGRGQRVEVMPYKLFEIVEGARLVVATLPGATVSATLALESPTDRPFVYRTRAQADDAGIARLRLPYATPPDHAYLVRAATLGRSIPVVVGEQAVVQGRELPLDLTGP